MKARSEQGGVTSRRGDIKISLHRVGDDLLIVDVEPMSRDAGFPNKSRVHEFVGLRS